MDATSRDIILLALAYIDPFCQNSEGRYKGSCGHACWCTRTHDDPETYNDCCFPLSIKCSWSELGAYNYSEKWKTASHSRIN